MELRGVAYITRGSPVRENIQSTNVVQVYSVLAVPPRF